MRQDSHNGVMKKRVIIMQDPLPHFSELTPELIRLGPDTPDDLLMSQLLRCHVTVSRDHVVGMLGLDTIDEYAYCIPNLYTTLVHQGKGTAYPR